MTDFFKSHVEKCIKPKPCIEVHLLSSESNILKILNTTLIFAYILQKISCFQSGEGLYTPCKDVCMSDQLVGNSGKCIPSFDSFPSRLHFCTIPLRLYLDDFVRYLYIYLHEILDKVLSNRCMFHYPQECLCCRTVVNTWLSRADILLPSVYRHK